MADETPGEALRRLRTERKLSLRALGARAAYSGGYLHQIEQGQKPVSAELAARLDAALGTEGELGAVVATRAERPDADAGGSEALRAALAWMAADTPQAIHRTAGRRVGASLASDIERRIVELRRMDDHLGGGDTLQLVERDLRATEQTVAEASYSTTVGTRLLVALAELHQLAGWVASDAGLHARAERLYLDGVYAAQQAGNGPAAGSLLSSLAYQQANVAQPADAVLLARAAVRGAGATGRAAVLLLERLAWSHARAGNTAEADRTLTLVDETDIAPAEGDPDWVYWLDRTEVQVMAGRCHVELRRPLRAVPLLTDAIDAYPAEQARETGLYRTWLAESYLHANEHDAARAELERVAELSDGLSSARLSARLHEVSQALTS